MIRNDLYREHKFVAVAFLAIAGLPAAPFLVYRGQPVIAAGAAVIGGAALWFMIGYVQWLRGLNAVRQARVLPPEAVAAISQQVGPPPVAIRAVVRGCQVVAAAFGVLAALLLVATDSLNPLDYGLALMLAAALVLVGAGYVVSGRRVVRQGDPNSLYGLTVALCLITSGALVYGIQHFDPHRWGELLGYAVSTVALAALGCLPFARSSARWLNNHRAAAAAYRLAHRPVRSASTGAGQPSSPIGTSDSPTTTTVSTTSAHDDA